MQRITVQGGWVEFREPEDVPERLRRKVITMAPSASRVVSVKDGEPVVEDLDQNGMDFLFGFNDAIALCLITAWAWPQPVSLEGLQDLPGNVYDEIIRYCQPLVARLMPNFGVILTQKPLSRVKEG